MVSHLNHQTEQVLTSVCPGRSLGIVPRSFDDSGYIDLRHDDYPRDDFLGEWQDVVIAAAHRLSVSLSTNIVTPLIAMRLLIEASRCRTIVNSPLMNRAENYLKCAS
jgi:hypothetical protein